MTNIISQTVIPSPKHILPSGIIGGFITTICKTFQERPICNCSCLSLHDPNY